jgi:hypothetical protein
LGGSKAEKAEEEVEGEIKMQGGDRKGWEKKVRDKERLKEWEWMRKGGLHCEMERDGVEEGIGFLKGEGNVGGNIV